MHLQVTCHFLILNLVDSGVFISHCIRSSSSPHLGSALVCQHRLQVSSYRKSRLVVVLGDGLNGPAPGFLYASRPFFLVALCPREARLPRDQIYQLYSELRVLKICISQHLLLPEPDIGVISEHLGVLNLLL